jgi:xylulokinase
MLGVDVGTSATKGLALDTTGRVVGVAQCGYALSFPRPGWVEVDPAQVWAAVAHVIGELSTRVHARGLRAAAMAFAASGDDVLFLDAVGRPVGPGIMALDVRSEAEGARFASKITPSRLHRITGLPPAVVHPLIRLIWLRVHRPAQFGRVRRVVGWGEWLAHRLGLPATADPSLAARTMAWEIRRGSWSSELLDAAGLTADLFPSVVASGTPIGVIPQAATDELGVERDVLLVAGGLDQYVAALGAGCAAPGDAMVGTGSWEALTAIIDRPLTGDALAADGHAIGPYVLPGRWAAMATSVGGGSLVHWIGEVIRNDQPLNRTLSRLPRRPTGLLVLPHIQGSYSPWLDPASRAAVLGVGLETTRYQLVKAVLEGITFELRENVTRLAEAGIPVESVRCTGGGARSGTWLQMKADILDRTVLRLSRQDTGAVGAACLAGAGAGLFDSPLDGVRRAVRVERVYEPRVAQRDAYAEIFRRYRELYPQLRLVRSGLEASS